MSLCLLFGLTACLDGKAPGHDDYRMADRNRDDRLDAREFSSLVKYDDWDENNDGIVRKDEFYDGLFAAIDANKDNSVGARELDREVDFWNRNGNPALDAFAQWDAGMNGRISREELCNKLAAVIDVPNGETLAQNLYVVWDLDNDDRIEMLELENVAIRFDADHN